MSSMESGTQETRLSPPRLESNNKQVEIVLDVILYIANFMEFQDYRNFVRALWPSEKSYYPEVHDKLWQLSSRRFTMLFINGKPLEVRYNYDPERTSDAVLIDSKSLLPVFGRVPPPDGERFMRITYLKQFVDTHVHLNQCARSQFACCPCNENVDNQTARAFLKPVVTTCERRHFHHYCSYHVNYWLNKLVSSILHVERTGLCDKDAVESFVSYLDSKVYFRGSEMQIIDSLLFRAEQPQLTRRFNDGNE